MTEKYFDVVSRLFGVAKNVTLSVNASDKSLKINFTLQTVACNTFPFHETQLSLNVAACVVLVSRLHVIDNLLANLATAYRQKFDSKAWPDSVDQPALFNKGDLSRSDQYFCESAIPTINIAYGKISGDFFVKLHAVVNGKQELTCVCPVDGLTVEQAVKKCRETLICEAKQIHKLMVERTQIYYYIGVKFDTEKLMGELAATCAGKELNMIEFAGYLIIQSVGSIVKVDESGLKHEYVSTLTKETSDQKEKKEETSGGFVGKEGLLHEEKSPSPALEKEPSNEDVVNGVVNDYIMLTQLMKRYPNNAESILEKIKKGK